MDKTKELVKKTVKRAQKDRKNAVRRQKRATVAPALSCQEQIAGLRAEVERLTAEKADLAAKLAAAEEQIETIKSVSVKYFEAWSKVTEERDAIASKHQQNIDFLKANNGQWMLIVVEE